MSYQPDSLLQLLQRYLKHKPQINQIHSLLITNGHLLKSISKNINLKWANTLLYNTLIRALLNFNNPKHSLILFTHMLAHQAPPNSHTFPSVIKAVSKSLSLASTLGRPIHSQVVKRGLSLDAFINTSLVSFYAQFGDLVETKKVFDEMPEPSIVSVNSMLDALGKNREIGSAVLMFEGMLERDVVSWTSIINGFGRNGCFEEAVKFFERMMVHEDVASRVVKPNEATLVSVLSSCSNLDGGGALYQGMQIHGYIIKNNIEMTVFLGTGLISLYGKMGCMENTVKVFKGMVVKEVCTWNAMISSFASNGREKQSLAMFEEMRARGLQPNEVTFVVLLTACSRGKFVDLGLRIFHSMLKDHDVVPRMEHYGCVVDLLGRAGLLEEAHKIIKEMPYDPDATVLGALLGACKVHGDVELARDVGRRILALQPKHCGRYVVLSNIYAEAGRWGHAAELRNVMIESGIRKIVAHSCLITEIKR